MLNRCIVALIGLALSAPAAQAIPFFARKYNVNCSQCHLLPPALNSYGQAFVANGYKLDDLPAPRRTVPAAVWWSHRLEINEERGQAKAYPNRVEIISSDAVTPWLSYFVEWRAVSYQTAASQRLLARHGRFEDAFVQFFLPGGFSLAVGQFRMLSQWDVSRRLTLTEPTAFSAGVRGGSSRNARLQSLRSFSLAGRAPAIRATLQTLGRGSPANGWFHEFVVPLTGELSAPLGEEARRNASFELEGRPKGFLYETYYRQGLSSLGGAIFAGNDRWLANLTGALQAGRHSLIASAGTARFREGLHDFRLSIGDVWIPTSWMGMGVRLDHQSAARRKPSVSPHINFSFPGGSYTFLLTVEQQLQRNGNGTAVELSAVF